MNVFRNSKSLGFTAIETLLAMVGFVMFFLLAVSAFKSVMKGQFAIRGREAAESVAKEYLGELKFSGWHHLRPAISSQTVSGLLPPVFHDPTNYPPKTRTVDKVEYTAYALVEQLELGASSYAVAASTDVRGARRVTVTVEWRGMGGQRKHTSLTADVAYPGMTAFLAVNETVTGVVTSTDGVPIPGVGILGFDHETYIGFSDAGGAFQIARNEMSSDWVFVHPGFNNLVCQIPPGTPVYNVSLRRPCAWITGVVSESGLPAGGAYVWARQSWVSQADAGGNFILGPFAPGVFSLGSLYNNNRQEHQLVTLSEGQTLVANITRPAGGVQDSFIARGTVRNSGFVPVPGVPVGNIAGRADSAGNYIAVESVNLYFFPGPYTEEVSANYNSASWAAYTINVNHINVADIRYYRSRVTVNNILPGNVRLGVDHTLRGNAAYYFDAVTSDGSPLPYLPYTNSYSDPIDGSGGSSGPPLFRPVFFAAGTILTVSITTTALAGFTANPIGFNYTAAEGDRATTVKLGTVVLTPSATGVSGMVLVAGRPTPGALVAALSNPLGTFEPPSPNTTNYFSVFSRYDGSYSLSVPPGNYHVYAWLTKRNGDVLSTDRLYGGAVTVATGLPVHLDFTW